VSANNKNSGASQGGCGCGTIGIVIAVILSWQTWHSILWATVHGLLSWFYVVYWWIYYSGGQ
jgi:hypothetical protein